MIVELPAYKMPSITNALRTTIDRGWVFLRKAGTIILAICIVLWYLGSYPTPAPETAPVQSDIAAEVVEHDTRTAKAHTFIGRLGRTVEPVFEPMGADWQLSVGILSSFLAREVFVSTMAVVLTGAEEDDAEEPQVIDRIVTAKRDGGGALFTPATSAALLIYYILAMQCLPTVAVTARETGKWSYALLQLGWMCGLAYVLAVITYQVMV